MTVAVILAGGFGTRLRNVISDLPKPLAPIHGRPFLEYQMDYWIEQGVEAFVLSVGYLHERIIEHFGARYRNKKIEYAIEKSPLGTGGALMLALKKVRNTDYFLLLNGDTYYEVVLSELEQFAQQKNADWSFCLFRTSDTQRYMGISLDENQKILQVNVKSQAGTCTANGGVYLIKTAAILEAEYLKKFSDGVEVSLERDVFSCLLSHGSPMYGFESKGTFIDIGIPEDYRSSSTLFEARNIL